MPDLKFPDRHRATLQQAASRNHVQCVAINPPKPIAEPPMLRTHFHFRRHSNRQWATCQDHPMAHFHTRFPAKALGKPLGSVEPLPWERLQADESFVPTGTEAV